MVEPCSPKIGANVTSHAAPISKSQAGVTSEHMKHPTTSTEAESFFIEPASPRQEARTMASDVICLLLIWMSDGRTLEDRGLRACVALYCIRPDLIDGMTLDGIGVLAGCDGAGSWRADYRRSSRVAGQTGGRTRRHPGGC